LKLGCKKTWEKEREEKVLTIDFWKKSNFRRKMTDPIIVGGEKGKRV